MAFGDTFNVATPAGDEDPTLGDNRIRELKDALQERLVVDHVFAKSGDTVDGTDTGKHSQITLDASVDEPTPDSGDAILYPQTVSAVLELWFKQNGGTARQLTANGGLINVNVDDATIEQASGVTQLKDGGTQHAKLHATGFCDDATIEIDGTNGVQIKAPADCYSPVERSGEYTGTGALQTITVGFSIKRLVIKCTAHAISGDGERESGGIYGSAAFKAWDSDGTLTTDIALSGTDFTVKGISDKINKLNNTFYWWASGERA